MTHFVLTASGVMNDILTENKLPKLLEYRDPWTGAEVVILIRPYEDKEVLVIAFRGSNEWLDWFTNLFAFHVKIPYSGVNPKVHVHAGFIIAYHNLRSKIHDIIEKDMHTIVVTTGYSQGAALAQICALDLQYNFPTTISIGCVTFEGPKWGNKAAVKSYNHRVPNTIRVIHKNDLVTLLPLGLKHTGGQIVRIGDRKFPWLSIKDHLWKNVYKDLF